MCIIEHGTWNTIPSNYIMDSNPKLGVNEILNKNLKSFNVLFTCFTCKGVMKLCTRHAHDGMGSTKKRYPNTQPVSIEFM